MGPMESPEAIYFIWVNEGRGSDLSRTVKESEELVERINRRVWAEINKPKVQ